MKSLKRLLLAIFSFVSLLLLTHQKTALQCGTRTCGGTDLCCGQTCYNPNTHICYFNSKLCGIQDLVCNNRCYNVNTHHCTGVAPGYLCELNQLWCAGRCYNPVTHSCLHSTTTSRDYLCAVSDGLCGTTCYNRLLYKCTSGTLQPLSQAEKANKPCGTGTCGATSLCCEDHVCYNPVGQSCFSSSYTTGVCPKAYLLCRRPDICYDPAKYRCIPYDNGSALCPRGSYTAEKFRAEDYCLFSCNGDGCYVPPNFPFPN